MRSMVEGRRDSVVSFPSARRTLASLAPLHRASRGPPPLEIEGRIILPYPKGQIARMSGTPTRITISESGAPSLA